MALNALKKAIETGKVYVFKNQASGKLIVGQTEQPIEKRLSQYNYTKPKNMTNKRFADFMMHGKPDFTVLSTDTVKIEDLNQMEEHYMEMNHCLELGLNTNHAPKTRNKNAMTRRLCAYSGRYRQGEQHCYNLSTIYSWASQIIESSNETFDNCDFNSSFITFVTNGKSKFEVDEMGAGEGYYKERCGAYIRKYLTENPDGIKNVRVYTNKYFFNNAEDMQVLRDLNHVCYQIEKNFNEHGAIERAKNSKVVAETFAVLASKELKAKRAFEEALKKVALKNA